MGLCNWSTMEMTGPYHPLHYLRLLSATNGYSAKRTFPELPSTSWWDQVRSHLVLVPGQVVQVRPTAPAEMHDLISSQVFQDLCMGYLEHYEDCHVLYDNDVDSSILGVLNNYVSQNYAGSVDNLRSAGVRLPSAEYEQAIELSLASHDTIENALFRWPVVRSKEASESTRFVVSPLTAAVVTAVAHEFGIQMLFLFLKEDYEGIPKPDLVLIEYYSPKTHMCCCPAQKTVVLTALLAGIRLFNDQGSMPQQPLLPALPNELWLCVLSHMLLVHLAPFPKAKKCGRL